MNTSIQQWLSMYDPTTLILLFVMGGMMLFYIINSIRTGRVHRAHMIGGGFISLDRKKTPGLFWLLIAGWVTVLLILVTIVLTGIV